MAMAESSTYDTLTARIQNFVSENRRAVLIVAGVAGVAAAGGLAYYATSSMRERGSEADLEEGESGKRKKDKKKKSKKRKGAANANGDSNADGPLIEEREKEAGLELGASLFKALFWFWISFILY